MYPLVLASSGLFGACVGWVAGKIIDDKYKAGCPITALACGAAIALIAGWLGWALLGCPGLASALLALPATWLAGPLNRAYDRAFPPNRELGDYAFCFWVALWSAGINVIVVSQVFLNCGWRYAAVVGIVGAKPLALAAYGLSRLVVMSLRVLFERLLPPVTKRLNDFADCISACLPCGRISRRRRR
jgi:uncharacterized membrane protein YeaQ/YmgE (transglycosylase-associated protein family)